VLVLKKGGGTRISDVKKKTKKDSIMKRDGKSEKERGRKSSLIFEKRRPCDGTAAERGGGGGGVAFVEEKKEPTKKRGPSTLERKKRGVLGNVYCCLKGEKEFVRQCSEGEKKKKDVRINKRKKGGFDPSLLSPKGMEKKGAGLPGPKTLKSGFSFFSQGKKRPVVETGRAKGKIEKKKKRRKKGKELSVSFFPQKGREGKIDSRRERVPPSEYPKEKGGKKHRSPFANASAEGNKGTVPNVPPLAAREGEGKGENGSLFILWKKGGGA